jgi:hypothetical protein
LSVTDVAGAIGISDEETWFTNGWGWRQLVDRAVEVAPPEYRDLLDGYRVQPGLTLSLLAEKDRVPVAEILSRAAADLVGRYEGSADGYERSYAERLRQLVSALTDQIPKLRPDHSGR